MTETLPPDNLGPLPSSRKTYLRTPSGHEVPARSILLTTGEEVLVYDTSGPYTDDGAAIDLTRGLNRARRAAWIADRGDAPGGEPPKLNGDEAKIPAKLRHRPRRAAGTT